MFISSFLHLLKLSTRMPVWLQATRVAGPCTESMSTPMCPVRRDVCGLMLLSLTQVGPYRTSFFITGATYQLSPPNVKHSDGLGPIPYVCENALFTLKLCRISQDRKLFSLVVKDFSSFNVKPNSCIQFSNNQRTVLSNGDLFCKTVSSTIAIVLLLIV